VQIGSGNSAGWAGASAGGQHSVAVDRSGGLWTWGYDLGGELGNGTSGDFFTNAPGRVLSAVSWSSAVAGCAYTMALDASGNRWAFGYNQTGQLGDGPNPGQGELVSAPAAFIDSGWASLAAGCFHAQGLKTDGSAWEWGTTQSSIYGPYVSSPQQLSPAGIGAGALAATSFRAVAEGFLFSAAIESSGPLLTWGDDGSGQLGNGDPNRAYSPTPAQVLSSAVAVSAGYCHTVALAADGTLWSWGCNSSGQLGDGTTDDKSTPVQVVP
jgi:alpha-tubulin suppressor-like RCC1 family protein